MDKIQRIIDSFCNIPEPFHVDIRNAILDLTIWNFVTAAISEYGDQAYKDIILQGKTNLAARGKELLSLIMNVYSKDLKPCDHVIYKGGIGQISPLLQWCNLRESHKTAHEAQIYTAEDNCRQRMVLIKPKWGYLWTGKLTNNPIGLYPFTLYKNIINCKTTRTQLVTLFLIFPELLSDKPAYFVL